MLTLFLVSLSLLPAQASDFSSLPVGYMKVTESSEGKFHVTARCALAVEVLQEAAARTGLNVDFDPNMNFYVSIDVDFTLLFPDSIDKVARAMGLQCAFTDDVFHVILPEETGMRDKLNAFLTDEQIQEKYSRKISPEKVSEGIAGGAYLIYDGNYVQPPYQVSTRDKSDGTCEIAVNGLPVGGFLLISQDGYIPPQQEALKPGETFQDMEKLLAYVRYTLYPQLLRQCPPQEAVEKASEFLEEQPIVKRVGLDTEGKIRAYFTYKDHEADAPAFPANYDFTTGGIDTSNVLPIDDQKQMQMRYWKNELKSEGAFFLCGSNGSNDMVSLPKFKIILNLVLGVPDLNIRQKICLWSEIMDRTLASFLSTNGKNSVDSFCVICGISEK